MNLNDQTLTVILDEEYVLPYGDELKIAEETINRNLAEQAGRYAFYAMLEEMAEELMNKAKLALDMVTAAADAEVRDKLTKAGGKFTETMVSSAVVLDPTRLAAIAEFNQMKANVGKLHAIRDAFNQRKDCLIALSLNMRDQRNSTSLNIGEKREAI